MEVVSVCVLESSVKCLIPALNLGRIDFTEEHATAIEAVLEHSYPQPAEHPASSSISHFQYGFANIPAGTEHRPVGLSSVDDTVLVVSRDLRCRAHFKSLAVGNRLDVVVPGYGICTMPNVDFFESDNVVTSSSRYLHTAEAPGGVRILTISFSDIENDHLLPRFLALVGGRLRTLSLRNFPVLYRSVGLDLCSVAAACPVLETLHLCGFEVTISEDNDALRSWSLKKLDFDGSDVDGLIRLLRDPICRTSRDLVELQICRWSHIRRDRNGQQDRFRFTLDDLSALKAHDGEFLPVVKETFPLRSKISFISVVNSRRTGRFLDSSMLSVVFAFAAIPEQRRVVISYGGA
jgi:hypothetical protein